MGRTGIAYTYCQWVQRRIAKQQPSSGRAQCSEHGRVNFKETPADVTEAVRRRFGAALARELARLQPEFT